MLPLGLGCSEAVEQRPSRAGRLGVLADLVLYERLAPAGGPFFLDRFETTRLDWQAFLMATGRGLAATPWGSGPVPSATEALPVSRVTLTEARQYARWRRCRLPRLDEWDWAATGRGAYEFPWGDRFEPGWVNSWELGLSSPTPVGTFESGRDDDGAYDLLGNLAEWTESPGSRWFEAGVRARIGDSRLDAPAALALAGLPWIPALGATHVGGTPWPTYVWIAALDRQLERWVVGGHFRAKLDPDAPRRERPSEGEDPLLWGRQPLEHGDSVGLRLATDPLDLLCTLLAEPEPLPIEDQRAVRLLLERPGVRRALARALPRARRQVLAGPTLVQLQGWLR